MSRAPDAELGIMPCDAQHQLYAAHTRRRVAARRPPDLGPDVFSRQLDVEMMKKNSRTRTEAARRCRP